MPFALFEKIRRKRAIDLYLTKLRPQLGRMFGKREHYSPEQVEQAVVAAELPIEFVEVGMALYATPGDFDAYQAARGSLRARSEVREEIGTLFFKGNARFTRQDLVDYAAMRAQKRELGHALTADDRAIAKYGSGA
jgi:hypothetical protein